MGGHVTPPQKVGPSGMPRLRDAVERALAATPRDRTSTILGLPEPVWSPPMAARRASLFWVSEDMSAVAASAGSTLPPDAPQAPPANVGLIVWAKPIDDPAPLMGDALVHGVLWWSEQGTIWHCWVTSLDPVKVGPPMELTAPSGEVMPTRVGVTLLATWTLMMQPLAVTRTIHRTPPRGKKGSVKRPPLPVSIIALRPRVTTGTVDEGESDRNYSVRWVVRGYWRNQPVGTEKKERRLTWVTPHVKGPEDAPLRTERVHVWRR